MKQNPGQKSAQRVQRSVKVPPRTPQATGLRADPEPRRTPRDAVQIDRELPVALGELGVRAVNGPGGDKNVQQPVALGLIWGAARIAIALGVSKRRAFYLLEHEEIPGKKVGGRWVTTRDLLRQYFQGSISDGASKGGAE